MPSQVFCVGFFPFFLGGGLGWGEGDGRGGGGVITQIAYIQDKLLHIHIQQELKAYVHCLSEHGDS